MATIDSIIAGQDKKQKALDARLDTIEAMLQQVLSLLQPEEANGEDASQPTASKSSSTPAKKSESNKDA
jgi:hypothetical protein